MTGGRWAGHSSIWCHLTVRSSVCNSDRGWFGKLRSRDIRRMRSLFSSHICYDGLGKGFIIGI